MAGKGSPKGVRQGGRKKGVPNKATRALREVAASTGLLPHEFLLAVCRGEVFDGHVPSFDERLDAAGKAAPYYAPKLANVEHTGKDGGAIVTRVEVVIVDAPG
jgi:hypothetical protein